MSILDDLIAKKLEELEQEPPPKPSIKELFEDAGTFDPRWAILLCAKAPAYAWVANITLLLDWLGPFEEATELVAPCPILRSWRTLALSERSGISQDLIIHWLYEGN